MLRLRIISVCSSRRRLLHRVTPSKRSQRFYSDNKEAEKSQPEADATQPVEEPQDGLTYSQVIQKELAKARKSFEKGDLKEEDYDSFLSERFTEARSKFIEKAQKDKRFEGRSYTVRRPRD